MGHWNLKEFMNYIKHKSTIVYQASIVEVAAAVCNSTPPVTQTKEIKGANQFSRQVESLFEVRREECSNGGGNQYKLLNTEMTTNLTE